MVEAPDPCGMVSASTPIIRKKMCLRTFNAVDGQINPPSCHFHNNCWPRISGLGQILSSQLGSILCQGGLVEAPDLYGMVPASTPNMYKVVEHIHLLQKCRLIHHHTTSNILVGQEFWEVASGKIRVYTWVANDAKVH